MKANISVFLALVFSATAGAQDAELRGTYRGDFATSQNTTVTIRLTITSVEEGVVKGNAYRSSTARGGGQCAGEYLVQGTLKGNELDVQGKAKQRDGECNLRLRATLVDGRLEAKFGANEFVMRK